MPSLRTLRPKPPALVMRAAGPGLALCLLLIPARAEAMRLLALRVDFQPDTLETTSGDGTFASAFRDQRQWAIDPLPHDSLYFDSHLRFLEHWYGRASGGALELEWEIWPPGVDASYRLPHPMWHYHWNQSDGRTDEQLSELFRHSLQAADDDPRLLFLDGTGQPRFDAVLVFHAGVGQDFGEDATPHDIPSAWLGPGVNGQPAAHEVQVRDAEGGPAWTVRQGLLLPEGQNHADFQHGLAGLIVLQFGHELGLPNLYNSRTGSSVIGKWGLMDQGSANFSGLLPAPLDAWCRLLKGWGEAEPVSQARDSVLVAAPDDETGLPRIVRIPLTESEYYLVEYRRRQTGSQNWTWARDRQGRWARLDSHYEISFQDTLGVPGDSTGVLVEAGNLDFDLPGSGLLVWHVDERAANPAAILANSVNDDPARRGVDLEEGDGVQDIGRDYGLFSLRGPVALGGAEDPWQQPSTGWFLTNSQLSFGNVSLAWDTEPSTATNDGLYTGLRLDRFSGPNAQDQFPAAGRFNVSWDDRPACHGLLLCPAPDSLARANARLQGFSWPADGDSPALALSLLDGRGRSHGLVLAGGLATWPRADGGQSLLPPDWQNNLRGLWQLELQGEARLLALRGDSLALFRPLGLPRRFTTDRFWASGQAVQGVLATGGGAAVESDRWAGRAPGIFVVTGQMLITLDPATLELADVLGAVATGELSLVEVADGSSYPGLLVKGPSPRVLLAGHNVLEDGEGLPAGAELLAVDALSELAAMDAILEQPNLATALLRDPEGATLFHREERLLRIDCANRSVRPIQFGPDPGLELAFQLPEGGLRIYSQTGTRMADLPLEDGHGAPLTGSRLDDGGLALLATAADRLTGMDGAGVAGASWPRVMPPLVDGPLALPELGLVLGLGLDGRLAAWQAALEAPVWTQPRGGSNGGGRATHSGTTQQQPVRAVREHAAFVWPNPAATEAHLRFWLAAPARVTMTAYDTAGDRVATLSGRFDRAGEHELLWSVASLAPGAYFCLLEAEGGDQWTRRVKCAVIR